MSIPSKSPRSSRHNSFSNLFGLTSKTNNEIESTSYEENHEGQNFEIAQTSKSRDTQRFDDDQSDDSYEDEYDEQTKSATYTQNHPMGRILLDLANEEGKSKKANKKMNVDRLCQDFYEAMQMEARNRDRQMKQLVQQVEESILKKELTSHTVSLDIRPPHCYSSKPILLTMAQRNECSRLFPTRNKFGNTAKDQAVDVIEFLHAMNSAHEACKISKGEFKEMLLACTTGKPHSLIRGWISSGYDITTIYHYLQVHFDTRVSAEEASEKLRTYKAHKTANLAKVQAHLMELATRSSSQVPEGPSRAAIFDLELTQALINSLPHESQQLVRTKYHELSARQGRAATASELSQALHTIRHVIDQDIKKNGTDRSEKTRDKAKVVSNYKFKRPFENGQRKFKSTLAVNLPQSRVYEHENYENEMIGHNRHNLPTRISVQPRRAYIPMFREGAYTYLTSNPMKQEPMYTKRSGGITRPINSKINGPMKRSGFAQKKVPMRSFSQRGPSYNNNYCSLCGRRNHVASHGCPNMVDDNGKIISVLPTHSTCTDCPAWVKPRLNHPVPLCPYRKSGPPSLRSFA